MGSAVSAASAVKGNRSRVWSSLVAIGFAVAAALSCAFDQLITLSSDFEPPAVSSTER